MENTLAGNAKAAAVITLIRQLSGDLALFGFLGMPELQTSLAASNDVAHEVLARMTRKDTVLASTCTNSAVCKKDQRKDQLNYAQTVVRHSISAPVITEKHRTVFAVGIRRKQGCGMRRVRRQMVHGGNLQLSHRCRSRRR